MPPSPAAKAYVKGNRSTACCQESRMAGAHLSSSAACVQHLQEDNGSTINQILQPARTTQQPWTGAAVGDSSCRGCTQQVLTSRMRRRQESGNTTSTHSSDMTTRPSPPVSQAGAPPGSSSWTCGHEVCVHMKATHRGTSRQGLPPSSSCCTRTKGAGKRDQQRDARP